MNLADLLFGPLAGPECRRSLGRGWVILVRTLAGVVLTGVALLACWWWWVFSQSEVNHNPNPELRIGLAALEGTLLTIAVVLGPAVLAGSLAGEKERGSLGLLLTTRASSREIVTGRIAGKMAQIGMILLTGVPPVILLARFADLPARVTLTMLVVPLAVTFGGGGLSALASVLSRRGRDALLVVYLIDIVFVLIPGAVALRFAPGTLDHLVALNPYSCIEPVVWNEDVALAWTTVVLWVLVGLGGTALASWRLRPACLGRTSDEQGTRRHGRRLWVPVVDEARPMLWKELFVERVGSLGRVGSWIGFVLVLVLAGGSLALTALIIWGARQPGGHDWADWARANMADWVGKSSGWISLLIQLAIGLRAAVSISSERERGTWDALLTSPLEAGEIVRGKLWGSLYALRWLIASAYLAWALGAATETISVSDAVTRGFAVLILGAFMAAVGVRTSLANNSATRGMAVTIGVWLVAYVAVGVAAGMILAAGTLLANFAWIVLAQLGMAPPITTIWFPIPMAVAWPLAVDGIYLLSTILIVADTRLRFDRLAGRMTGGKMAVAFDALIYGRPEEPILVELQPPPNMPQGETTFPREVDAKRDDVVAGTY